MLVARKVLLTNFDTRYHIAQRHAAKVKVHAENRVLYDIHQRLEDFHVLAVRCKGYHYRKEGDSPMKYLSHKTK